MPISSKNILAYIKQLPETFDRDELINRIIDKKSEKQNHQNPNRKKNKNKPYHPHKDVNKINETLDALVRFGILKKNKKRFTRDREMSFEGTLLLNTTGDGMVTTASGFEIIIKHEFRKNANNNDRVIASIDDYRRGLFSGKIERVIRRDRSYYIAKVERKTKGVIFLTVIDGAPDTELACERKAPEPDVNQHVVVRLTERTFANLPECVIEKKYSIDDESLDFQRISIKHSLPGPHREYPELLNIEERLPAEEMAVRKDYRKLFTVTIDGETAKDFDDAISIGQVKKNYILYVHIADVSAYVRPHTPLDKEALQRGTSYYLGNNVIPMLPERLSNDLCSLREGVDRLTLSVEMTIDPGGNIIKHEFHRGIIKVNKRLTYNNSYAALKKGGISQVARQLKMMSALAALLKKKRTADGRIDLSIREQQMVYDGNILKEIRFTERLESHQIIEEFMLSANEIVSRALKEKNIPALYRIHERMSDQSLTSLKNFLRQLGLSFPSGRDIALGIQKVLDQVNGKVYSQVVNLVILKSMMQAYYGIEPLGHFGLGFEDYTHFTSPIRRYPDLIVHRCLKSLIDKGKPPYAEQELHMIGEKSSELERIAQKAEWDLVKLKTCRMIHDQVGQIFDVVISGVSKYGVYVSIADRPIEGMIPMRTLTDDYYLVKEDDYTVIGKRYGRRFRLGDRMKAKLTSVDIEKMRIDFEVA